MNKAFDINTYMMINRDNWLTLEETKTVLKIHLVKKIITQRWMRNLVEWGEIPCVKLPYNDKKGKITHKITLYFSKTAVIDYAQQLRSYDGVVSD